MGTIIIYENGQQIEVDEENVKIYQPFPEENKKKDGESKS